MGDEGGEVERAPDLRPPAPDAPFADLLARLAGMGRETGEHGDLAAIKQA